MGNVIQFQTKLYKKKRGFTMYEKLVSGLEKSPANHYVVREAEHLADRILQEGGFDGLVGPTPILAIVKQFQIATYQESNLKPEVSGNIFIGGNTNDIYNTDKVIVVGSDEEFYHQRFIIAHELAHFLMDYIGNEEYKKQGVLFSRAYLKESHHTPEEIRADRFAAELLMPAKIFIAQYINAMERSKYDRRYTIRYLSTLFETKESSINRRIEEVILS